MSRRERLSVAINHLSRIAGVVTAILAFLTVCIPIGAAANEATFVPADRKLDWALMVSWGTQPRCNAVCREMTSLVMRQTATRPKLCGLVDADAARKLGIKTPHWRTEDYTRHLEEIKASVLSDQYENDGPIKILRQSHPGSTLAALRQEVWSRYGDRILEFFRKGEASYEEAEFDIDSDRVADPLYRISRIKSEAEQFDAGNSKSYRWYVQTCDGTPDTHPLYHLHVDKRAVGRLSAEYVASLDRSFEAPLTPFQFHGRSYLLRDETSGVDVSDSYVSHGRHVSSWNWRASSVTRNRDGTGQRVWNSRSILSNFRFGTGSDQ